MLDTISRFMAGFANAKDSYFLVRIFQALGDRYSSQPLNSAGLVIKAGGGVLAKTGATAFWASVAGKLVTIAASTDMPSLLGINITATFFNVVCFFVDGAGTVTALAGTQGATVGAVTFPQFPLNKALIGFLIITHSSTFTGNTTPLDTATTVFISPLGPFDPTVLT